MRHYLHPYSHLARLFQITSTSSSPPHPDSQITDPVPTILHPPNHIPITILNCPNPSEPHALVQVRQQTAQDVARPELAAYGEAVDEGSVRVVRFWDEGKDWEGKENGNMYRPIRTPLAPRLRALIISTPVRMPLSNKTVISFPTASTISGKTSKLPTAPSNCLPP